MRITIIDPSPGEEDEIIVKCREVSDDLQQLLNLIKQGGNKINGYKDGKIHLLLPAEIFYFESVDERVFAYCKDDVYEIKSRLYELEMQLLAKNFLRVTKSLILNLDQIKQLSPAFSGRFEAQLKNGEKVLISRQYVPALKERLGL